MTGGRELAFRAFVADELDGPLFVATWAAMVVDEIGDAVEIVDGDEAVEPFVIPGIVYTLARDEEPPLSAGEAGDAERAACRAARAALAMAFGIG